ATRGEYFYARTPTPGLPFNEPRVDYQELSLYAETAIDPNFSIFSNLPLRFLNPEINSDHTGLSDVSLGLKWAAARGDSTAITLFLQGTSPSGAEHRGLGTGHVTVEPGLLFFQSLGQALTVEAEARYIMPIGGTTDFASQIVRYGIGVGYVLYGDE